MNIVVQSDTREMLSIGHTSAYHLSTVDLIARTKFAHCKNPHRQSRRALSALVDEGILSSRMLLAPSIEIPTSPILKWNPGEQAPNYNQLSYSLERAWEAIPIVSTPVFWATNKAANRFGGRAGGINKIYHIAHELFITAVYLHFESRAGVDSTQEIEINHDESSAPSIAKIRLSGWRHEKTYAHTMKLGEKPGDARIEGFYPWQTTLIEIAGRYTPEHLESTHRFCDMQQLRYELWGPKL